MLQDAPGVQHQRTVLHPQYVAIAPVLQAAAGFAQGRGVAIQGEEDTIRQVVDPGQRQHDAFAYGLVATVVMGECIGKVVGQLMFLFEAFEQLDIAKQKVIDQVVEHFAEFVAHLFSLLLRVKGIVSASGQSGSGCHRCHRTPPP